MKPYYILIKTVLGFGLAAAIGAMFKTPNGEMPILFFLALIYMDMPIQKFK